MSRASPTEANQGVAYLRTMLAVAMRRAAVGAAIRRARDEKDWLQKDLAAAVHVEPVTVSRWERNATRPDLDMIEEIAEALEKPLSYFVRDELEAPPALDGEPSRAEMAAGLRSLGEKVDRLVRVVEAVSGVQEELLRDLRQVRETRRADELTRRKPAPREQG